MFGNNNGFVPNRDDIDIDINLDQNVSQTMDNTMVNTMNNNTSFGSNMPTMPTGPIMEAPQERVVQRNIVHEVQHVCPINTRIVNRHIFRHTYRPAYSCCEENVVCHESCGSCCNFR